MARTTLNRLNARKVATLDKPGRHSDGGNLYLAVSESGAKSWVFMWRLRGRTREIGLGSARDLQLARARDIAAGYRAKLAEGVEPAAKRDAIKSATFAEVSAKVIEDMRPGWRNEKHGKQWERTLRDHAAPLSKVPVDQITTEDVLDVLKPLWLDRNETASRLRSRIERVLDFAKAKGLSGENPARWRGHLDQLLPRRQRLEPKHLPAMPYDAVPGFMQKLRAFEGAAARALEFAILTAARTSEAVGAQRSEFDLEAGLWTIPRERMKGGREHQVPLSARALELVREAPEGEWIFPGRFPGTHLSDSVLDHLLHKQMKIEGATVHGFRSTFRDWAGDLTDHPRDVAEAALAHSIGNATEEAYRRATALGKRRKLMNDWSKFCGASNLVVLRKEALA
jgi:integrase